MATKPPPQSDFYSAAVARQARSPIELTRESSSTRPLLTHVPPAPPPPQHMTPPPDQFIQRACLPLHRELGSALLLTDTLVCSRPQAASKAQGDLRRFAFDPSHALRATTRYVFTLEPRRPARLTQTHPQTRPISTRRKSDFPRSTRRSTLLAPKTSSRLPSNTPKSLRCSSSRPIRSRPSSSPSLLSR